MKTTRHTSHTALSLAAALFTSTALQAAPVIYEPFAYTTGGLNGKGGTSDFGFASNWTASGDSLVSATNLQYGPLATTGGSIGGLGGSINRFGVRGLQPPRPWLTAVCLPMEPPCGSA